MVLGPRGSTLQLQADSFTLGCLLGIQFPTVGTELHHTICLLSYTPPLGVMGFVHRTYLRDGEVVSCLYFPSEENRSQVCVLPVGLELSWDSEEPEDRSPEMFPF